MSSLRTSSAAPTGGVVAHVATDGHDPVDAGLVEGEADHAPADGPVGTGHHDDLSHGGIMPFPCPPRGRSAATAA